MGRRYPNMGAMLKAAAVLLALSATPVLAVEAHYEAYAAGLNVIDMDADFDVRPETYRVRLEFRTVGGLRLFLSSDISSQVEGRFDGTRPAPTRFFSSGVLRGQPRVTQIDYTGGQPAVRQLQPPNETEREPVAPEAQRNTVDTLSAMAELMHQINTTGRCEGKVTTFDGRRLSVLEARTEGEQALEPTGRSSFAGPTLRCAFVGRQLGGFMLDEDRATLARPQVGTAWFASIVPGGPKIPVRIAFHTRWFGEATMYLANKPS
jgi:hypothetical protein